MRGSSNAWRELEDGKRRNGIPVPPLQSDGVFAQSFALQVCMSLIAPAYNRGGRDGDR